MALIVNGVTISETKANSLTINGVDATKFFVHGIQVYQQNLLLIWSGNSIGTYGNGLEVSGNLWRATHKYYTAGAWRSVSDAGIFSGDSFASDGSGIDTSGNLMRTRISIFSSTWVTYTVSTNKFSGSSHGTSTSYGSFYLYTEAGGMMRTRFINYEGDSYGDWISLNPSN